MMTFRKKNAAKRTRGSGSLKYCLRKELEEVRATHRELSQPGCEVALARWKIEAKDELDLRKEFAATLKSFLRRVDITSYEELESVKKERSNEVNKRLLALGYTESEIKIHYSLSSRRRALVEQPRVLSDRGNVGEPPPKLTPILESNKAQTEEDARSARKTKRQAELHKLLREFKLETHPLADMVRELGHEPKLPEPTASNGCPFPDTHTALGWSFFKEITANEMSLEDVRALFDAHRKGVEEKAGALPPLNDMVEVNGSTDSTISLCSLPRLLLRADTIFSRRKDAAYDEQLLHYPLFIPTKDQFWSHDWPLNIVVSQYVFHSKASAVARALLKDLGKPDASGLEMSVAGKVFMSQTLALRTPNLGSVFLECSSLHDSLVHQIAKGGSAPVPCDPVYYLLCKNYGRMFVGVEQGQMDRHLQSVHQVVSGVQDIHWGLVLDSGTFLQNGGAWRERWDEYYAEREKTDEQGLDTDEDERSDAD
ncbi:unnamed protein product [Rhizoctonia solani]|uniref:Uncharacterized protein n=1 Tax=Rhizoctonia solani TaxID=456999 RepID=A0A8H3E2C2_9AGAM|nr:unnamed protein product [Rhizoctonia solani]